MIYSCLFLAKRKSAKHLSNQVKGFDFKIPTYRLRRNGFSYSMER